jgi:poly(3-hydroxybutyrate) depolymerase
MCEDDELPAGVDWDDAYSNGAYIPDGARYPDRWRAAAAAFRATARCELDLAYGAHERERYDLFLPAAAPRGLVVFVHGGYWLAFAKADWSHLAAGPLAHGWAVAIPSYPLCPDVRIRDIVRVCGAAVGAAAQRVAGPIVLTGHSAGGHVTARLVCTDTPLPPTVAARIVRAAPISGLFDLRPLMRTRMNTTLGLDCNEAKAESPASQTPRTGVAVAAFVGADERPEFLRQTQLLPRAWPRARAEVIAGRHHFNVIEELENAQSGLCRFLCA